MDKSCVSTGTCEKMAMLRITRQKQCTMYNVQHLYQLHLHHVDTVDGDLPMMSGAAGLWFLKNYIDIILSVPCPSRFGMIEPKAKKNIILPDQFSLLVCMYHLDFSRCLICISEKCRTIQTCKFAKSSIRSIDWLPVCAHHFEGLSSFLNGWGETTCVESAGHILLQNAKANMAFFGAISGKTTTFRYFQMPFYAIVDEFRFWHTPIWGLF